MATEAFPSSRSSSVALPDNVLPPRGVASPLVPRVKDGKSEKTLRDALLALPAYLALLLATGSACYALAHYVASPTFTFTFMGALLISVVASYGANWGGPALGRLFQALKGLLILVWLPMTMIVNTQVFLPPDMMAEANTTVASLVGLIVIISIAMIGLRVEGHTIPLATPLVPTLSLFGLLNIIMVDNIVQISFLLFVAGALYLVAYERMLHRLATGRANEIMIRTVDTPATVATSALHYEPTDFEQRATLLAWAHAVGRKAAQYLLACGVWFGIFIAGAGVLYYPLHALMPGVLPAPAESFRRAAQNFVYDWRRPGTVLELQGGTHNLSAQPIMQARILQGQPSGLWRGRVYEIYNGSIWEDTWTRQKSTYVKLVFQKLTPLPIADRLPPASKLVRQNTVIESIEPLNLMPPILYASGYPVAMQVVDFDSWKQINVRAVGTMSVAGYYGNRWPYVVKSVVSEPGPGLIDAPGLAPQDLAAWRRDPLLRATLGLPDRETEDQIKAIARQITQAARASGQPVDTPYQKVQAVSRYLQETCTYSLNAPRVPMTQDAVVFFLTESRQGACDMFASSMALLLRAMDVPTRLVTGYLGTEQDQEQSVPSTFSPTGPAPEGKPTFVLRERDAHAWVEYYVPRAGWLSHDPSAGTRLEQNGLEQRIAALLRLDALGPHWRVLALVGLGLLLLLVGGVWSFLDRRHPARSDAGMVQEVRRRRIAETYGQAVGLLRRRVPRLAHYTPLEYENAINRAPLPSTTKLEFAALTHLFVAAQYASPPPNVAETELQASLQRLRQSLS
ncbi:MAG: transglutaminase domain-containing protein [Armatimonadota bacterium]|nr:transglutaminase domain-containing protein [Armatimonadota bacterium]